jgi:succinate-semialdehyde dehydrogenase/glutarate-semialdehyde dehydrogenase
VNPSTGETERHFDELTDAQLDHKLERAVVAFRAFRRSS